MAGRAAVLGRDISVREGERGTKAQLPKLRQRLWGLLWALNVVLPSLCNAPIASSHQYVGLLMASVGIFPPGLMPSNHTRSYLLKEKLVVKFPASGDLPWACSWAFNVWGALENSHYPSQCLDFRTAASGSTRAL